jgi:hypothetical protein
MSEPIVIKLPFYIMPPEVTSTNHSLCFLVLHPVERNITIFNKNTSVRNQTIRVLFITTYTALHVSAYMQAIFRSYPTILQKSNC